MTSRNETKINLEGESTPYQKLPASAEAAYDRLTGYGFARRYVKGKVVADIGREEVGYGPRLLAETAESVTGLSDLPEAVDLASAVYSAPNVSYRRADLPKLPLPEGRFDVVVAFGLVENLDRPEALVREAKRILKEDGVFVISARDKQTNDRNRGDTDGRREMYVPEFRELLERHFGHVQMYRQGAVAGGFVFPPTGEEAIAAPVETARFSLTDPRFGAGLPTTRSVIAVCSDDAEALRREEERPYLLLERDRRVFDEYEERVENLELMRGEIGRMQETEVQAFIKAIAAQQLPLGVLLRLMPQLLLYYLYNNYQASPEEGRHRRDAVIEEVRRRREITLEEARGRRDAAIEEVRRRREITLEEARGRRDAAIEDTRHHRNLTLEELRHRRNTTLEHIIHRRNIIFGNMHAIRQKGAIGSAKGAFRRLSALYRQLREGQKP